MKKLAVIGAVILAALAILYLGYVKPGPEGESPASTEDVLKNKKPPKPGLKPYLGGLAWTDGEWIYPDEVDKDYNATTKAIAVLKYVEEINRKESKKAGNPTIVKYTLNEVDETEIFGNLGDPGESVTVMEFISPVSEKSRKFIMVFETDDNNKLYVSGVDRKLSAILWTSGIKYSKDWVKAEEIGEVPEMDGYPTIDEAIKARVKSSSKLDKYRITSVTEMDGNLIVAIEAKSKPEYNEPTFEYYFKLNKDTNGWSIIKRLPLKKVIED